MECPQCRLDVMPGAARCFQCEADMAAPRERTARDFMPPRAEKRGLSQGLERERPTGPLRPRSPVAGRMASVVDLRDPLNKLIQSLLPGLGQLRNCQLRKAKIFAAIAAALLLLNVVFFRHSASTLLVASLALTCLASMVDAFLVALAMRDPERAPARLGLDLLSAASISVFVLVLIQLFSLAVLSLFFDRFVTVADWAEFDAGDTLLTRPWDEAARGDFVLVRRNVGAGRLEGTPGGPIDGGFFPERIVGLPGELVEVTTRHVTIAGKSGIQSELTGLPSPQRFVLEEQELLTLQSGLLGHRNQVALAIARRGQVRARVVAVLNPPTNRRLVGQSP